mmetsp:Transcript_11996/g.21512  ORF Transcript_11996/g.21512 Transcript_11996/m.21512 type:complete len:260 (+) Transcript_11996:512-1291(+)
MRGLNIVGIEGVASDVLELLLKQIGGENGGDSGLERDSRAELIEQNLVALGVVLNELLSNKRGLAEGNANLVGISNSELIPLALNAGQLGTTLVTNGDNDNILTLRLSGGESGPGVLSDVRVKTTAKTLVRSDGNDNGLVGVNSREITEKADKRVNKTTGLFNSNLGILHLGRGNHLHGLGNLTDVLNSPNPLLDSLVGGIPHGLVLNSIEHAGAKDGLSGNALTKAKGKNSFAESHFNIGAHGDKMMSIVGLNTIRQG